MRFRNHFRLLVLFLLFAFRANSQSYPVQLSTQLVPPFSGYLPDYASPGNQNFRVFILFTDFSRPTYDLKLKLKIEGQGIRIESQLWYYAGPVTVEPGVPLMLSGSDLAGLLDENNLTFTGISRTQYDQRKILPEGFYTITVVAYDYQNPLPVVVSNEGTTQAWMMLNDAPLLNLPACGSEVQAQTPQQLTFSWTTLTSPFSAGTEYTFELWEIFPANSVPGNIVASTAPIYSEVTTQTLLNYSITEPPLVVGREYVWRVKARDVDNRELFRNNGVSPLCTFSWGNSNNLLGNLASIQLHAQALTHRMARCTWDSLGAYASYQLDFRKAVPNANWFPLNTNFASLKITDLEPNTNYEARVRGVFSDGSFGPWSNTASWHTLSPTQLNCGETSPPPAQQNFHPLTQAMPGMIWQVGQFEMSVLTLVNSSNSAGWYSGTGKVFLPFGSTVVCEFTNIQIGDDHTMYAGEVRALTDGVTNWLSQYNNSGFVMPEIVVNSEIHNASDIHPDPLDSTITVGGQTFYYEPEEGTAIEDANGSLWVVTSNGTIVYSGQTGVVFNPPPPSEINTNFGTANFAASPNQLYGYDSWQVSAWKAYYNEVTDLKDNSQKVVDWKSVQQGKYDEVEIHLAGLGNLSPDSIFFYCPSGTIYASHGSGLNRKIYLVGGNNNDRQDIYAGFYNANHQLVNIGKLCVVSFIEETKKLWLVSLGDAQHNAPALQLNNLQQQLDSIYRGAVIKWQAGIVPQPLPVSGWDLDHNGELDVTSGGLSHYSGEMESVISALKYQPYFSPDDYYFFVSAIPPDSGIANLSGEMPRKKNFGFVFTTPGTNSFVTTIAHELAHGSFALEHSFEGNAPAPKSSTSNLMDYNGGRNLVAWQWMWMHNPAGWTGLDENGDGAYAYVDMRELLPFLNSDSATFTFYSPAGLPVSIPKNGLSAVYFSYGDDKFTVGSCPTETYAAFPVGALVSFVFNGTKYISFKTCGTTHFNGYETVNASAFYVDTISPHLGPNKGIVGYPCVSGEKIVFAISQQQVQTAPAYPENGYKADGEFTDHVLRPDYLTPNIPTTQIDANIFPPYSEDATDYLVSNLDDAGCGSTRASYVLTYAYQINAYPEVYNCCFKLQETTTQNPQPGNIAATAPNAYTSVATTTPYEQQLAQVHQLEQETRTKFYEIDQQRKHINQDLLMVADANSMAVALRNIQYTCVWNCLWAKTRVYAIQVLCQSNVEGDWWGFGNNYETLVNDLLAFTNDPQQQDSILVSLKDDHGTLLKTLWDKLDLDALDKFVHTITAWLANDMPSRPTFTALANEAYIGNPGDPAPEIRYFEFYTYTTESSLSQFRFTSESHWVEGVDDIYLETYYDPDRNDGEAGGERIAQLDAYDWVAVKICEDMPDIGLKKNQGLVVPVFWAKWLSQRIQTTQISGCLSFIGQVILFLATDGIANTLFEGAFVAVNSSATLASEFVGQDIRAVVLNNAVENEIATAEAGANGEWTFKNLKWAEPNGENATVIGKLENARFTRPNGELATGELEVVATNSGVAVREAYVPGKTLTMQPSYLPGRTITGNVQNPSAIIGCYQKTLPGGVVINDTKQALEELVYPVETTQNFTTLSVDGFKMLNCVQEEEMSVEQFWAQYNEPWMKATTDAHADVYVLSDRTNDLLKYKWELNPTSGEAEFILATDGYTRIPTVFGKEIDYMENLVAQGKYIWNESKGCYQYVGN